LLGDWYFLMMPGGGHIFCISGWFDAAMPLQRYELILQVLKEYHYS
jgi:hypothetical protein